MNYEMNHDDNLNEEQTNESEISSLDLQIIQQLQQDGRMAYSKISRELGVPEATVRYRVKRLVDDGIITINAFLNTGKLNYANVAYIEIETSAEFHERLLQELIETENISYLSAVTGEYNIMLEYVCQSNEDLLEFTNWLKRQPEVHRLNVRVILKIFKAQYPIRVKNTRQS